MYPHNCLAMFEKKKPTPFLSLQWTYCKRDIDVNSLTIWKQIHIMFLK